MIYGLYLSGQGVQVQSARQDVVANNLANASTNSFKRDLATAQAHQAYDVRQGRPTWLPGNLADMPGGVTSGETVTDFSQGALNKTGSIYDLALFGKGFLHVADGKQKYLTRDGQVAVNQNGQLVTQEHGFSVLSAAGSAIGGINPELPIEVLPDGSVLQGDTELGKIAILDPQRPSDLSKAGRNLYTTTGKTKPSSADTLLRQGHVEGSGVQPITSMMELIESSRTLEANVNMIHTQDESLDKLLQSLPRK